MWSLCLSIAVAGGSAGVPPRRVIIQAESTDTVQKLFEKAQEAVGRDCSATENLTLKIGAPRPTKELDPTCSDTLAEVGIQNQEKITVLFNNINNNNNNNNQANEQLSKTKTKRNEAKNTTKNSRPKTVARATTDNNNQQEEQEVKDEETVSDDFQACSPSPPKRARRAAAQKATDSFADVIRAQDAALENEAAIKNKKKTKPSSSKDFMVSSPPKKNASHPPTPNRRFQASHTEGRKLSDGSIVVNPTARRRQRQQRSRSHATALTNGGGGSDQDASLALLGALESTSKEGRLMREGWRQAIRDRYEQNRAAARLAAFPHAVQFSRIDDGENNNNSDQNTRKGKLKVTFAKGVQGRGNFEDEVDYIAHEAVVQVVSSIHPENPEALRPSNLALLSPRMFWSIAYHANISTSTSTTESRIAVESMEQALQWLVPSLDWSFLRRRKQTLSAKARENLRQKQAAEESQENAPDWEAAAAAIESVEKAMENSWTGIGVASHSRLLANGDNDNNNNDTDAWQLVVPTETRKEELLECIEENLPSGLSANELVQKLIDTCHISNYYQLATTSKTAEELASELDGAGIQPHANSIITDSVLEAWMDVARQETMHDMVLQLCNNNPDAVDLLRSAAQSGTPSELAVWLPIVEDLHSMLVEGRGDKGGGGEEDISNTAIPSIPELTTWCLRAQRLLDDYQWLDQFTTPIVL